MDTMSWMYFTEKKKDLNKPKWFPFVNTFQGKEGWKQSFTFSLIDRDIYYICKNVIYLPSANFLLEKHNK